MPCRTFCGKKKITYLVIQTSRKDRAPQKEWTFGTLRARLPWYAQSKTDEWPSPKSRGWTHIESGCRATPVQRTNRPSSRGSQSYSGGGSTRSRNDVRTQHPWKGDARTALKSPWPMLWESCRGRICRSRPRGTSSRPSWIRAWEVWTILWKPPRPTADQPTSQQVSYPSPCPLSSLVLQLVRLSLWMCRWRKNTGPWTSILRTPCG